MSEALPRSRAVTMTIHKHVLGTRYSGAVFVTGTCALHVQLHMDEVIGLIVDDIIILLYECMGYRASRTVRVKETIMLCCHGYQ